MRNGKVEEFTNLSLNGVIEDLKLSADGKRMGIMMTTPITPSDIYLIDIGKDKDDNNNVQKITHSLLGNIPENLLIRPDLIRYKGFDGLEISAFLYKPKEEIVNNRPQKFGVILSVHGGPTAQEKPLYDYSGLYQYLANNRLAMILLISAGARDMVKVLRKKYIMIGEEMNLKI